MGSLLEPRTRASSGPVFPPTLAHGSSVASPGEEGHKEEQGTKEIWGQPHFGSILPLFEQPPWQHLTLGWTPLAQRAPGHRHVPKVSQLLAPFCSDSPVFTQFLLGRGRGGDPKAHGDGAEGGCGFRAWDRRGSEIPLL